MASVAVGVPLPCQVRAFFCQASMQEAAILAWCLQRWIHWGISNSELQRPMVRYVEAYQDHHEICMLSPADLT